MAAKIVPQLFDAFVPLVNITAHWDNATASYGNKIDAEDMQNPPNVHLLNWPETMMKHNTQLTIAITDPDAPSNDDPKWSQVCHWLTTKVPLEDVSENKFTDIIEYKPPGPPPKTGFHRYVFVALAPLNGTTKKLHLSKPKDRQHWGYDGDRAGVREWAGENGLGVIG